MTLVRDSIFLRVSLSLLLAGSLLSCTSASKYSQNNTSSISAANSSNNGPAYVNGWKSYSDKDGHVRVQLPPTWVGFSAFDGSPITINYVGDVIEYGEKDGTTAMVAEIFDANNSSKQSGETWYQFFIRLRLDSFTFKVLKEERRNSVHYYELSLESGGPGFPKYYYLFETDNFIGSFGFFQRDAVTNSILSSLTFTP